jgi:hypothetical protein
VAPQLCIEVVSRHHPYKDYARVQEKYAVIGVEELWVWDPQKFGPRVLGGPVWLQLWRRNPEGVLVRRHFADGPVRSELLGAWLLPRGPEGLVIADDAEGTGPWLGRAEQERERAEQERERADREHRRVVELEAELARLRR